MEFLEDILKQYGIVANYWLPDESVDAPEKQVDKDALRRDAVLAGADPRAELLEALDRHRGGESRLPLDMSLGDIRAEKGQVEAALRAYELAVLEEDDPASLCELGYLLLQRCRVDELPLCDKDFDGASVEFPGGEEVFISSHLVDFENPGPEFPDKPGLLDLAVRAFGKAYVRCAQEFIRDLGWPDESHDASEFLERAAAAGIVAPEDTWHELVALDGLRAAFMEADNLDGLECVISGYYEWLDDCEEGVPGLSPAVRVIGKKMGFTNVIAGDMEPDRESPFYDFELNCLKAQTWLRARRKGPPRGEAGLTARDRLLLWHLRELSQQLRDQHGKTEQWDSLLQSIEQKLESAPKRMVEASRKRLAEEYGDSWDGLPLEVQRLVIQADFLRSMFETVVDADWAPVVLQYARALETLLQKGLGARLDKALKPEYSYTRARLEHFRNLFNSPQFAGLKGLPGADRMRDLGRPLDDVIRNYRTRAAHGAEPVSAVKADEMVLRLLGPEAQRVGLVWEIASL